MAESNMSNKEDETIDSGKSSSSFKQRRSEVYKYYTFNASTKRWHCDYCS